MVNILQVFIRSLHLVVMLTFLYILIGFLPIKCISCLERMWKSPVPRWIYLVFFQFHRVLVHIFCNSGFMIVMCSWCAVLCCA